MNFLLALATECAHDSDCGLTYYCLNGSCLCLAGYYGPQCNYTESECRKLTCNSLGSCVFVGAAYKCNCTAGSFGPDCSYTQNQCSATCFNGAQCDSLNECICPEGSHLDSTTRCQNCSDSYTDIGGVCHLSSCVGNGTVCGGHGLCDDSGACDCDSGYYGLLCDMNQTACDAQKCSGHGYCSLKTNASCYNLTDFGVGCTCNSLFSGCDCGKCTEGYILIEAKCVGVYCVRPGSGAVCSNSGTCAEEKCRCNSGNYGKYCEVGLAECNQLYCNGKGVCDEQYSGEQGCTCSGEFDEQDFCASCRAGFAEIEQACVSLTCTNDNSTICSGNGECIDETCVCAGYFGEFCDLNALECGKLHCNGNGACNDSGCICADGYEGKQCESCRESEFVLIGAKCYHRNCVADNIVCSFQGVCLGQQCSCAEGRFGRMCELSAAQCAADYCNGNGACTLSSDAIYCACSEGWLQPSCLVCDAESEYILVGSVCAKASCVKDSMVCGGIGECKGGACVCIGAFGAHCEITQRQCNDYQCGGVGYCIRGQSGGISCKCGAKVRETCCKYGYLGSKCLPLGGLIGASVAPVVLVAAILFVVAWIVSRRRLQEQRNRRNVEKHYVSDSVKTVKQGRNFFMV